MKKALVINLRVAVKTLRWTTNLSIRSPAIRSIAGHQGLLSCQWLCVFPASLLRLPARPDSACLDERSPYCESFSCCSGSTCSDVTAVTAKAAFHTLSRGVAVRRALQFVYDWKRQSDRDWVGPGELGGIIQLTTTILIRISGTYTYTVSTYGIEQRTRWRNARNIFTVVRRPIPTKPIIECCGNGLW